MTDFLRLAAMDEEDLKVISACVQDAVIRTGDMEYLPKERRMVVALNRFVWEKPADGKRTRFERRRSVLHFDRVESVASAGINRSEPGQVLLLLAVTFNPEEAPTGIVELHFSGGAGLRLKAECIEARLTDLGSAWETRHKPAHPE